MKTPLHTSLKTQSYIALILTAWAFVFAFFAKPFAHGYMNTTIWLKVSITFSLALFFSYILVSLLQNYWYYKTNKWTIYTEIACYFLLFFSYTVITYIIYKSPIINGFYNFETFFLKISSNTILIVTPIVFITRKYVLKPSETTKKSITIKGDNKLDVLKINPDDIICISNAQNYVEVFYTEANTLKTKLLRTSLRKLLTDFDFLVQIHRSHLLNPKHFKTWKDTNTIEVSFKELPVSKSYKKNIIDI